MDLAIVEYVDQFGEQRSQLALIGDNTVLLIKGLELGITTRRDEQAGPAQDWLRDAVFAELKPGKKGKK